MKRCFIFSDYGVLVRPTLRQWSEGGQDRIMLRMLDTDNIRVISSILGQSIALDHYAKKVLCHPLLFFFLTVFKKSLVHSVVALVVQY